MKVRRGRRRGQALVEFAIVAPIFFLLLMGIIEVGRFIYHYEVVNNATRDGARYAIVHGSGSLCPSGPMPGGATNLCDPTGSRVQNAVYQSAIAISRAPSDITVSVAWCGAINFSACSGGNNGRGQIVVVTADFSYRPLLPVPFPSVSIHAESSLVINH